MTTLKCMLVFPYRAKLRTVSQTNDICNKTYHSEEKNGIKNNNKGGANTSLHNTTAHLLDQGISLYQSSLRAVEVVKHSKSYDRVIEDSSDEPDDSNWLELVEIGTAE